MGHFNRFVWLCLAIAAVATASPVSAQNFVTNPSFEDPVLAPGGQTVNSIPGWTGGGGSNHGVSYNLPQLTTPFGNQWAYLDAGNQMSQTTTKVIQANETYILTAHVGLRTDNPLPGGGLEPSVELWAGGTSVSGSLPGGTFITGQSVTLVQGAFVARTIVWTPPPGSPLIGQTLSVRLATSGGVQTAFDNVSLTTPAPVPTLSEWALIMLGLLMAGGAVMIVQRRAVT